MITNKYAKDYRLENVVNEKGKTVTKPVYVGKYYVFERPQEEVMAGRKLMLISAIVSAASLMIGMGFYNNTGFTSQYYTSAPFMLCAFPLLYFCMAVYSLMTFKDKCTREKKDHTDDRIAKCSFVGMLLSAANISGIIVASVLKLTGAESRPLTYNDIIYIIASVVLFASFFTAFKNKKKIEMKETEE